VPGRVIAVESDGKGKLRVIVNLGVELRATVAANDPRASARSSPAPVFGYVYRAFESFTFQAAAPLSQTRARGDNGAAA
jgi:hypothetical protein